MSREHYLNTYTPTIVRALRGGHLDGRRQRENYPELCSPDFYRELEAFADDSEIDLTADEQAYVEEIQHGRVIATGIGGAFLLQELDYWSAPYAVEPGVTRRIGTAKIISAENKAKREEHAHKIHERWAKIKAERERVKAVTAEELAREQAAWDMEQERLAREREERLKQTMEADLEWAYQAKIREHASDAAASKANPFSLRSDQRDEHSPSFWQRHYRADWDDWDRVLEEAKNPRPKPAPTTLPAPVAGVRGSANPVAGEQMPEPTPESIPEEVALAMQRMDKILRVQQRARDREERKREAEERRQQREAERQEDIAHRKRKELERRDENARRELERQECTLRQINDLTAQAGLRQAWIAAIQSRARDTIEARKRIYPNASAWEQEYHRVMYCVREALSRYPCITLGEVKEISGCYDEAVLTQIAFQIGIR